MERYNIFYQIHKGLRALLHETALKVQRADFDVPEEADEVIKSLSVLISLFEEHAHTEDNYILHPLEEKERAVSELFGHDHEKDHQLGERLSSLLVMLRHTQPAQERKLIGSAIRLAFTEFLVFNLEHMASEESTLNSYLWKHYTDEQLHGITIRIVSEMSAEYSEKFNRIMMRGLSNTEITGWLQAVQASAPEFVYRGLLRTAENELPAGRYMVILDALKRAA
jgi:hypothetical protein